MSRNVSPGITLRRTGDTHKSTTHGRHSPLYDARETLTTLRRTGNTHHSTTHGKHSQLYDARETLRTLRRTGHSPLYDARETLTTLRRTGDTHQRTRRFTSFCIIITIALPLALASLLNDTPCIVSLSLLLLLLLLPSLLNDSPLIVSSSSCRDKQSTQRFAAFPRARHSSIQRLYTQQAT